MADGLIGQVGGGPELHVEVDLKGRGSLVSSCCVGLFLGPGC